MTDTVRDIICTVIVLASVIVLLLCMPREQTERERWCLGRLEACEARCPEVRP